MHVDSKGVDLESRTGIGPESQHKEEVFVKTPFYQALTRKIMYASLTPIQGLRWEGTERYYVRKRMGIESGSRCGIEGS